MCATGVMAATVLVASLAFQMISVLIFTETFALQLGHPHLHLFIFFRNLLQLQLASWRRCIVFLHRMCVRLNVKSRP